jgi:hypothetical protein
LPFATTRATLSRQWALLRQLPSRSPGITSAELVWRLRDVGFTVSKRTVERDLNELSLIFPLERNDKSIPFGWHWSASAVGELRGNFDLLTLRGDALQPAQGEGVELVAWISDALARQLREAPLEQRHAADGAGAWAPVTRHGERWLAIALVAVEPWGWGGGGAAAELREEIGKTLSNAAAQYQKL